MDEYTFPNKLTRLMKEAIDYFGSRRILRWTLMRIFAGRVWPKSTVNTNKKNIYVWTKVYEDGASEIAKNESTT